MSLFRFFYLLVPCAHALGNFYSSGRESGFVIFLRPLIEEELKNVLIFSWRLTIKYFLIQNQVAILRNFIRHNSGP